jgi:hypothetical protein
LEAKVEIFLRTWRPWQTGQITSLAALALRSSSSNGVPQSVQMNSNRGIIIPPKDLDAEGKKRLHETGLRGAGRPPCALRSSGPARLHLSPETVKTRLRKFGINGKAKLRSLLADWDFGEWA